MSVHGSNQQSDPYSVKRVIVGPASKKTVDGTVVKIQKIQDSFKTN